MQGAEAEYCDEVMARICRVCVDGDGCGGCRLGRGEGCALREQFPAVLSGVRTVTSTSMEPYEAMLHLRICVQCSSQMTTGECPLRKDLACALDRYFPLVVCAIEEKDLETRFAILADA
jgi:hypothetical protein